MEISSLYYSNNDNYDERLLKKISKSLPYMTKIALTEPKKFLDVNPENVEEQIITDIEIPLPDCIDDLIMAEWNKISNGSKKLYYHIKIILLSQIILLNIVILHLFSY